MDLGLKGKNALVAASSQGLGFACAMELAREGANVLICGRRPDMLAAAHKEIEAATAGKVASVAADVADPAGQSAVLEAASRELGGVDILVTNSGGPPPGKFEEHGPEAWDNAYRLLLASAVALINGVLPHMKAQHWGRIIAITSQAVKQPVNNLILSNSVRASVAGLCKSLANELGSYGITVNNVMPGYTRTERMKALAAASPGFVDFEKEVPLGRIGEPEEFASVVAFLASARASYVTGVSIPVDGGWVKTIL